MEMLTRDCNGSGEREQKRERETKKRKKKRKARLRPTTFNLSQFQIQMDAINVRVGPLVTIFKSFTASTDEKNTRVIACVLHENRVRGNSIAGHTEMIQAKEISKFQFHRTFHPIDHVIEILTWH
ncbi:hypothetical protein CKAN_00844200 [Cinnamomum micranthum f. kanehirae]|uniref:Uncharacterized protein n=1 Tax=Cinnamomum micranthum f. kanehirae TaxID=337451 RepID=A0A443NMU8_9MAGN|nr:hypothetical protein CKAN_00844200 [Cinnamomum micranthum f. kanehirae]